jgi:flagellin-like protein
MSMLKGDLLMAFTKNDEAVSPVIGVILMVAITVILAAVIAAFVFGMAGNISKTKVVAATASHPSGTNIVVTYQGGQDHSQISTLSARVGTAAASTLSTSVGASVSLTGVTGRTNHVVVTALFTDGTSQVILDTYV